MLAPWRVWAHGSARLGLLSVPILLSSPIGRDGLGFETEAPLGLRDDVLALLLSLSVIFYSSWVFFAGAWNALRGSRARRAVQERHGA